MTKIKLSDFCFLSLSDNYFCIQGTRSEFLSMKILIVSWIFRSSFLNSSIKFTSWKWIFKTQRFKFWNGFTKWPAQFCHEKLSKANLVLSTQLISNKKVGQSHIVPCNPVQDTKGTSQQQNKGSPLSWSSYFKILTCFTNNFPQMVIFSFHKALNLAKN